jgi:hypothetical protein
MVFCRQDRPYRQDRPCLQDRPCRQDRPLTIEVESRGISWTNRPCRQDRPVTIEVGFLSESDDEVEFLQMIE